MKWIKQYGKYILLFLLFLVWNLIICPTDLDEIWNYGFSVSMYQGLIPYKDFNMVITPLCNFLFSIPFHLFGSSMLVFHIEGAIILTLASYLLFKLIGNKAWIIISTWFIGVCEIYPNYNFFIFLLLLIIIICEKKEVNDYLIGLLIGLTILTKQTIGVCMMLPCIIYYIKDYKKVFKRIVGILIPNLVFIIYLILTKSLYNFIDLCILGLFDFAGNNTKYYGLPLFILIIVISLFIIKKEKNISNYYILAYYSIGIPIFDLNHMEFVLFGFILLILMNKNRYKVIEIIFVILFFMTIYLVIGGHTKFKTSNYPNHIQNFEYRYLDEDEVEIISLVNDKYNEYKKNNSVIILSMNAYYFKLINNDRITYLDLINTGNWGHNGSEKMMKEVKKNKGAIYFIDSRHLESNSGQTNSEIIKYVAKNAKKIDECEFFGIYKFK